MQDRYTHAILELIHDGKTPEAILSGLARTLQQKGHGRLHRPILNGVLRVLSAKMSQSVPVVTVVNPTDLHTYKDAIESALRNINAPDSEPLVRIDPTLTGGAIVQHKHRLIDMSSKTKLLQLYRNVTK